MPLHRDNDEERAAIVERLLEEQRRQRRREPAKTSLRNPAGSERRVQPERRRGRSDVELRKEREALQRQWEAKQRSQRHTRWDGSNRLEKDDATIFRCWLPSR